MAFASLAHGVSIACPLAAKSLQRVSKCTSGFTISPIIKQPWVQSLLCPSKRNLSWGAELRRLKADDAVSPTPRQRGCALRADPSPSSSAPVQEQDDPYDSVDVCELVLGNEVELDTEGGAQQEPIAAYFAKAVKNNNRSGVLLLTDILGVHNEDTRDYAFRLACFGYNVFVPDLFRGHPWEEGRDMGEYDAWRAQHDPERVASDIALAHQYLAAELAEHGAGTQGEGRIALVGFCFGGGRVVEALAADTEGKYSAGVSFYGTRYDPTLGEKVRVPLLLIAGDSDKLVPVEFLKEVEAKLKDGSDRALSKLKIYEGRGHAFAHHPKFEDDVDADDAFGLMKEWLREHLLHIEPGKHAHPK